MFNIDWQGMHTCTCIYACTVCTYATSAMLSTGVSTSLGASSSCTLGPTVSACSAMTATRATSPRVRVYLLRHIT